MGLEEPDPRQQTACFTLTMALLLKLTTNGKNNNLINLKSFEFDLILLCFTHKVKVIVPCDFCIIKMLIRKKISESFITILTQKFLLFPQNMNIYSSNNEHFYSTSPHYDNI